MLIKLNYLKQLLRFAVLVQIELLGPEFWLIPREKNCSQNFGTSFEILIRLVLFRSKLIISSLDFCTCSCEENIFLGWNFYVQKLHANHCN